MGLAASQARLLTITSRLSSVELKQQRIAMDKMRLANDQQGVSEKYTNALNNKTLSFSNGNQEVAMDYSTLTSNGYSVVRASDGLAPTKKITTSSATSNATTNANDIKVVEKPTCPRPEEIEKPDILDNGYSSIPSHVSTDYGFNGVNHEMENDYDYLMTALNMVRDTFVSKSDGTVSNISKNYDYEKTTQKRYELWNEIGKPMIDNLVSKLQSSNPTVAEAIKKQGEYITNSLYSLANKTDTNANRSAMNIYKSTNSTVTIASNSLSSSGILDQLKSSTLASDEYNQNGKKVPTSKTTSTLDPESMTTEQKTAYNNWVTQVKEATTAWNEYDNYIKEVNSQSSQSSTTTSTSTATSTTTSTSELSPSEEFYNQLQNSQFLIQGLLSGYLSLMKDGQQISLSSATNIIESYDKTDDAAAEAEYNSQMAKINSKEKVLDMQAKRLDTEYSSLTTEYESIKSIISNHTSKDFSYFS